MPKKKKQSEPTVCGQSSQTHEEKTNPPEALAPAHADGEFAEEPADLPLDGDPTGKSNDELADIVIRMFAKLSRYRRYVEELNVRFSEADRDENNRLIVPIKGCHTFRDFCRKRLNRTAGAVYKMMRNADPPKASPKPSAAPSTPVPKEKPAFPRYADELSKPLIEKVTHSDYDAETQIKILRIICGNLQAAVHEIQIQSAEKETEAVAAAA